VVVHNTVYGKKSFLSKESDTLRSYKVYTQVLLYFAILAKQNSKKRARSILRTWI